MHFKKGYNQFKRLPTSPTTFLNTHHSSFGTVHNLLPGWLSTTNDPSRTCSIIHRQLAIAIELLQHYLSAPFWAVKAKKFCSNPFRTAHIRDLESLLVSFVFFCPLVSQSLQKDKKERFLTVPGNTVLFIPEITTHSG